jgi:hypothetical protein
MSRRNEERMLGACNGNCGLQIANCKLQIAIATFAIFNLQFAILWPALSALADAPPPDPLASPADVWRPPAAEAVKSKAMAWLDAVNADAEIRAKAEAVWTELSATASEDELLLRLSRTFALADPRAAKLMAICSQPRRQAMIAEQAWLRDTGTPPFESANLRLTYASWLIHESLYDEAQEQLFGLAPADVVAPAALLFGQSVVHHALLDKELGLRSIGELLQGADHSPRRYVALAKLMQEDLSGLQDDTLDHIARRMGDIRRRLDLGRAGPRVRKEQDGVIKSLDKLIKQMEDQQQEQEAGTLQPSSPASESRIMGGKGPGEASRKNIGSESGWGDLPPKQREEAMQQVGRDFPSHYRDAIEQYFRRLAAEGAEE